MKVRGVRLKDTYVSDSVVVVDERLGDLNGAILRHLLQAQGETAQQSIQNNIHAQSIRALFASLCVTLRHIE